MSEPAPPRSSGLRFASGHPYGALRGYRGSSATGDGSSLSSGTCCIGLQQRRTWSYASHALTDESIASHVQQFTDIDTSLLQLKRNMFMAIGVQCHCSSSSMYDYGRHRVRHVLPAIWHCIPHPIHGSPRNSIPLAASAWLCLKRSRQYVTARLASFCRAGSSDTAF